MNVEIRKTAQGTEYWNTMDKKIYFVPEGQNPGFEVTKNPKSMLVADGKKLAESVRNKTERTKEEFLRYLETMNIEQLLAYAKDNDIEVPGNMKKEETVRNHISEKLNADDE